MWSSHRKRATFWWKSKRDRQSYDSIEPSTEYDALELSNLANPKPIRSLSLSKPADRDVSEELLEKPLPAPPAGARWIPAKWRSFYHRRLRKYRGYHFGILICAITASVVALINLIFTIWGLAKSKSSAHDNLGTLEEGSCPRTRTHTFWAHLIINALSTTLLGASNYTMQCLSSPTRKEVDKAHSQGIWLDIGVPSLRNLNKLTWSRITLWWLLGVSSIPLHLLYNSAVFSTLSTRKYTAFVVSTDFLDGAPFDAADIWPQRASDGSGLAQDTLKRYQEDQSSLRRFEKKDCISSYIGSLQSANTDVILVSTSANNSNSLLAAYPNVVSNLVEEQVSIAGEGDAQAPDAWICSGHTMLSYCDDNGRSDGSDWAVFTGDAQNHAPVDYCLSQQMEEHCKLQFSLAIMIVVIICNIVKAVCMGLIVWKNDPEPLVTLGDAIASFLDQPDLTTRGKCIAGKARFEDPSALDSVIPTWAPKSMSWFRAASIRRWLVCNVLCIATLILAGCLYAIGLTNYALKNTKLSHLWSLGFGAVTQETLINLGSRYNLSGAGGLLATVLLANSPQLILSFLYFSYNGIFTCMLLAQEWNGYASKRKPLRVTTPAIDQRGTYYLQLPYRWGVPLLVGSGLLHWLVSQSIFLARVNVIDMQGNPVEGSISTCGYSPIALIFVLALGSFVVFVGIVCGFLRMKGDIPLVGSCSAAISAACHRPESDVNASRRPIKWGALRSVPDSLEEDYGIGHCCFTSFPVDTPIPGKQYAGLRLRGLDQ